MKAAKLLPKNAKARGLLSKIGTNEWTVIDVKEMVPFSDKPGPWYFVRPNTGKGEHNERWVNRDNDTLFKLEFL